MTETKPVQVTDGMLIEWDVPIDMDDGLQLRADIFRPTGPGPFPVLLSHGPYAKGASFQTDCAATWDRLATDYPEVTRNKGASAWTPAEPGARPDISTRSRHGKPRTSTTASSGQQFSHGVRERWD